MTFKDFVFFIGDLIEESFAILEALGNIPNVLLFVAGFIMLVWWLMWQAQFNKEAEQTGKLK